MIETVELMIKQPGHADRTVRLPEGATRLGLAEDNEVVLSDVGVSRRHAQVYVSRGPHEHLVAAWQRDAALAVQAARADPLRPRRRRRGFDPAPVVNQNLTAVGQGGTTEFGGATVVGYDFLLQERLTGSIAWRSYLMVPSSEGLPRAYEAKSLAWDNAFAFAIRYHLGG